MYTAVQYYFYDENYTELLDWNVSEHVCQDVVLPLSHIYLPLFYFLIFFTGVSGNFFVIAVMCGKHKSSRLVDTFVANLAMADLVFVFTLPLWAVSAAHHHRWDFGNALCKLSSYIIAVNRFSNIFFLTCMSADRYLAVVRLLDSRFLRTGRGVQLTCGAVWVSSLLLGVPSLVFRGVVHHTGDDLCVEDRESPVFLGLSLASFFLAFLLPVAVILFCYGSILARLRHHRVPRNPQRDTRRRHSLKIVFAIVAAFLVSWLPFNTLKGVLMGSRVLGVTLSCKTHNLLAHGLILSSCLAFFNSCANPIIYLLLDRHFQSRARGFCFGGLGLYQGASHTPSVGASDTHSGSAISRTRLSSINLSK
ncbi:probable G-protein coupled receptor 25 [Megalops cyprinoides]|uniref:probable G-protein coupled receptor 25 n=1 Tax=Megalops cyprinoides TaxID=118141 RepID=UPI001863AD82|nr:probable G-protein coupled receptor 25 [Megalops cyprinoides]